MEQDNHKSFYKEKRKVKIVIDGNKEWLCKGKDGTYKNGLIEKNVIDIVAQNSFRINVPKVHNSTTPELLIVEYMRGTSAFNMLACLSNIVQQDKALASAAIQAKQCLLEKIISDIKEFQQLNNVFSYLIGNKSCPYDYRIKSLEVIKLLDGKFKLANKKGIMYEIEEISSRLDNASACHFRDATPKNMIIRDPELLDKDEQSVKNKLTNYELSKKYFEKRLYHIDMRSMAELVPPEDDYISVVGHYMILPEERANVESRFDKGNWNLVLFARSMRSYGRRLYYWLNNREVFEKRYIHENMRHYWGVFEESVQRLNIGARYEELGNLVDFMKRNKTNQEFISWCN